MDHNSDPADATEDVSLARYQARTMEKSGITSWLARQQWLDIAADALQPAVRRAFDALGPARRSVKNVLHGTWLGHPLHPVLTDIPLGSWTATIVLDAIGHRSDRSGVAYAADATLALGLAGAVGAAVTGLADWSETDGRPRRLGVAHAALNGAATLLCAGALVCRARANRQLGRGLALGGYLAAMAAAYLGGELAFHEQVGMDHSAGHALPEEFTRVLAESDLPAGEMKRVHYHDTPLLLVKRDARVCALVETCAHLGGPLAEGSLEGDTVVCPWHSSRFALESGAVVDGPSAFAQPFLEVRIRDGQIEVRAHRP